MAYAIQGSVIIDDSRQLVGVSTIESGNINVGGGSSITIGAGGAYYGDGRTLSGVVTTGAGGTTLTEGDAYFEANVEVAGIITAANLDIGTDITVGSDITVGRNLDVTGIATVNDIYIENLLYDSNGQTGGIGSVLAVLDNKLQWVHPTEAGIATEFQPGSTFFVAENGSDDTDNDGLSPEKSWKTITFALSQIPTSGLDNDVLYVGAGNYEETFPLEIPPGLTIKGAGQRATFITPTSATETNDGFQFNDRTTLQDVTVGGFYKPQGSDQFAFSYAVGAALSERSPYISAVTLLNKGTETTATDPYGYASADAYPATAPGGGGVKVDGSDLDSTSIEAGFLLNEVTMFVPGATGIEMTNGARVEWINGFTYFAEKGVHGVRGSSGLYSAGQTRLSLSNASGGLTPANTIEYYDTDGSTLIASGTIDSTSGNYIYLTNAGTGTFVVPKTRKTKTIDFVNTAQLTTAQAKFGASSLDVTGAPEDCLNIEYNVDFGFGTGDFTVEGWFRFAATTSGDYLWDFRSVAGGPTEDRMHLEVGPTNALILKIAGSAVATTGSSAVSTGSWSHIAVTRDGSNVRIWVDGVQAALGSDSTDLGTGAQFVLGADHDNTNGIDGYIDEVRVEKGVAKYLTPFTAPTVRFQGDADTVLLLHLDGSNGATTTTEDVEVFQDIRISGSNTADKVTLADYSEFGADMRSSSCAVEYGNQGVVGDGVGVNLRLVSMNFSFVGANGSISNDPNSATQANEVTQLNGSEVSYVSIDHKGDFRVGESFYVNQETGEVSFEASNFDLTSVASLTITDGTNSSVVTPTSGRFGNLQLSGNTMESVTGDINLQTAGSGEVNIYGNVNVAGILTAQLIALDSIIKGDTSIALDDTGTDGTIRFNTDGTEAGRFDNNNDLTVTNDVLAGRDVDAARDVIVGRNLQVTGRQDVSEFFATNMFISGIATVGSLNSYTEIKGNTGVITAITAETLAVSGLSTLTGDVDAEGSVAIADDLVVGSDVGVGATLTVTLDGAFGQDVAVGRSFAVIEDAVFGGNILGDTATNISLINNISAVSANLSGGLTVLGSTQLGDNSSDQVTVNARINSSLTPVTDSAHDLGVTGFRWRDVYADDLFLTNGALLGGNLTVGGNTILGNAQGTDEVAFASQITSDFLPKTDGTYDLGSTTFRWAELYVDFVTITNDATIGGDLTVTDNVTTNSLNVTGLSTFVGLATFAGDVYVQGNLIIDGDNTQDVVSGTNLNISGVGTIAQLGVTTFSVAGNSVIGVTTAQTLTVNAAIASDLVAEGANRSIGAADTGRWRNVYSVDADFSGDVTVSGNLNVAGDISYDEVTGRNLDISGVGTIAQLDVTGITSAIGQLQFNSGIGSALAVDKLVVQDFQVGDQGLVFQQARAVNVLVTGVATHNSHVYNTGVGTFSNVTGVHTAAQLEIGVASDSLVGITTILDEDDLASDRADALATQQSIKAFVDSRELDVNAGSGSTVTVNLLTQPLGIYGTPEKITTAGAGTSVTVSLPNIVRVNQQFLIGGGNSGFSQMADFNTTGITFGKKLDLGTNPLNSVGAIYASGIGSFAANVTVGGDLTAVGDITANDYNSTSDIRKKDNIVGISSGLAKIEALRGVTFVWKDSKVASAGVVAQEVEAVLPESVRDRPDGTKTVNYNGLVGTLIEAVKELSARVEELEAKLQD